MKTIIEPFRIKSVEPLRHTSGHRLHFAAVIFSEATLGATLISPPASPPNAGFRLRFPFRPLTWIDGLEEQFRLRVKNVQIALFPDAPYLVLHAEPFTSEQEAAAFLPHFWGAIAWMAVQVGIGFTAEMQLDRVTYSDHAEEAARNLEKSVGLAYQGPVHGLVNAGLPYHCSRRQEYSPCTNGRANALPDHDKGGC